MNKEITNPLPLDPASAYAPDEDFDSEEPMVYNPLTQRWEFVEEN